MIGRTTSYMSTVENLRISKISSVDLIKIFTILYDIEDKEAVKKIEEILSKSQDASILSSQDSLLDGNVSIDKDSKIEKYSPPIPISHEDEFENLIKIMNSGFTMFFEKEPDDAERTLKRFISSMRFDLGFMIAILNIPFSSLRVLTLEERQRAYDDIIEAFKKNYDIAENKKKMES